MWQKSKRITGGVVDRIALTGTKLDASDTNAGVYSGFKAALTAEVEGPLTDPDEPESETNVRKSPSKKALSWSSSDETVATVDSATGVVTGVKAGEVTITAKSVNGKDDTEVTADIKVTVKAAPKVEISNDAVTLKGLYVDASTDTITSANEKIATAAFSTDGKKIVVQPTGSGKVKIAVTGHTVTVSGGSATAAEATGTIVATVADDTSVTWEIKFTKELVFFDSASKQTDVTKYINGASDFIEVSDVKFGFCADKNGNTLEVFSSNTKWTDGDVGATKTGYAYAGTSADMMFADKAHIVELSFTIKAKVACNLASLTGYLDQQISNNYGFAVKIGDANEDTTTYAKKGPHAVEMDINKDLAAGDEVKIVISMINCSGTEQGKKNSYTSYWTDIAIGMQ